MDSCTARAPHFPDRPTPAFSSASIGSPAGPTPGSMSASILMVDNHPANLVALEAVLEPLGQRLVRAGSGEQALQALAVEDFAVVLLDIRMRDLDGFETAT